MPITSLGTNQSPTTGAMRERETITITTGALLAGQSIKLSIPTEYKAFEILQVATDEPARIRVYNNVAYQLADESRDIETEAIGDTGVLIEAATGDSWLTINCSPITAVAAIPVSEDIPITITNTSAFAVSSITVELLIIGMEQNA